MRTLVAGALALTAACGARSALDIPELLDAASRDAPADVPTEPTCTALEYTSDDALDSPSLAVAGGYVYYVSSHLHGIVQVPAQGGTTALLASDPSGWASAFVVDDAYVWWVVESNGANGNTVGQVARVSVSGGPAEILGCATPNGCPATIGTDTFVAAQTSTALILGNPFNSEMYILPKAGGAPSPLMPLAAAPTIPFDALTVEGTSVLWATSEDLYEATIGANTGPTIVAQSPTGVSSFDGNAYWTLVDHGTSSLVRRDMGGTTTTLFTGPLAGPLGANAASVYGISDAGISRVPASGGASELVAPMVTPKLYVVDGACIYLIDGASVRRVPG